MPSGGRVVAVGDLAAGGPLGFRAGGLAEDGPHGRVTSRESIHVFLDGRILPRFAAQLDLQGQQLTEELIAPVRLRGIEVVRDRGRIAGAPRRLERLAGTVDGSGSGQRVAGLLFGAVAGHQPSSTNVIQVLRIRSSRRAIVRRAQPSWSAISSLV